MIYVALDLHKRQITAGAVAENGRPLAEARHLSTSWDVLAMWLAALRALLTLVLAATLYCWGGSDGSRPRATRRAWSTPIK